MKTRFVIAVGPITEAQSEQISNLFRDRYGWWHWIDGFWLVIDSTDTLTASWIRDQLDVILPGVRKLVLRVENTGNWAGFGPTAEDRDMFHWIRTTWDPD